MTTVSVLSKYPRTYHLPWSEAITNDDKVLKTTSTFEGRRVVVTEKMDGENTTMYSDYIHARSIDSKNHPSRAWVKSLWGTLAHHIPPNWRICGENLFAVHSIHYNALPSYFLAFSVWNNKNICMSWDDSKEFLRFLGISTVPVIYDGLYDEDKIKKLWNAYENPSGDKSEGYVIRVADAFLDLEFATHVGKFVRANHVQTDDHWIHQQIQRNGIKV